VVSPFDIFQLYYYLRTSSFITWFETKLEAAGAASVQLQFVHARGSGRSQRLSWASPT
jgi:hypothetical protein